MNVRAALRLGRLAFFCALVLLARDAHAQAMIDDAGIADAGEDADTGTDEDAGEDVEVDAAAGTEDASAPDAEAGVDAGPNRRDAGIFDLGQEGFGVDGAFRIYGGGGCDIAPDSPFGWLGASTGVLVGLARLRRRRQKT